MKAIRNTVIVALLAATPLAFANREGAGQGQGGCQGMQSSGEGAQGMHAERHARMAAMHQGMGAGMGMQGGDHRGHRHAQPQPEQGDKK